MERFVPGDTPAHRLDARTKLLLQAGFALAAFAHTTLTGLAALTVVVLAALRATRTPLVASLRSYRAVVPFLLLAPLFAGVRLRAPYFDLGEAVFPALAAYRMVLVLLVGTVYLRTTPVRRTRAAVQWFVPGRLGTFLGMGVAFVLRLLPLLRSDLARIREASAARLGTERGVVERVRLVGVTGLARAFRRADRFSLALRARCFAWNPTLPELEWSRSDLAGLAVAAALAGWGVVGALP